MMKNCEKGPVIYDELLTHAILLQSTWCWWSTSEWDAEEFCERIPLKILVLEKKFPHDVSNWLVFGLFYEKYIKILTLIVEFR